MTAYKIDNREGYTYMLVNGILTIPDVDEINRLVVGAADVAHEIHGVFRMLGDARTSTAQPQSVAQRFKSGAEILRGDKDRHAVVVENSLAKIQTNRIMADKRSQAFLSMDAAMMWLMAYASC